MEPPPLPLETGKVCVPIVASEIDAFDPDEVPTVGKLLVELEHLARRGDTHADWSKTSLAPYVAVFEQHAEDIVKAKTRDARGELSFPPGLSFVSSFGKFPPERN